MDDQTWKKWSNKKEEHSLICLPYGYDRMDKTITKDPKPNRTKPKIQTLIRTLISNDQNHHLTLLGTPWFRANDKEDQNSRHFLSRYYFFLKPWVLRKKIHGSLFLFVVWVKDGLKEGQRVYGLSTLGLGLGYVG